MEPDTEDLMKLWINILFRIMYTTIKLEFPKEDLKTIKKLIKSELKEL